MKKIAIAALAALAFAGSAFAEVKLSFYNKLYEEDFFWVKTGDDSSTDFPALKERMHVELESDQVDALVEGTFALDDYDDKHFGLQGEVSDWYIEFRPIEMITLGLHDNINAAGSYLPIYDDNLQGGNIGSDGFTVVVRPPVLDNALRIAVTTPFSFDGSDDAKDVNWFNGKAEDGEDESFHIGVGAILSLEQVEIGATFQNIPCSDDRLIGASVAFPTLFGVHEGLTVGVGFTNSKAKDAGFSDLLDWSEEDEDIEFGEWGFGVKGENVINAYATFEQDAISAAAEVVYSLADDEYLYNFYTGVNFGYAINDSLSVGATGKLLLSGFSNVENVYEVGVNADYTLNEHHSFGIEFDYLTTKFDDDSFGAIKVPVYWKYSL